MKNVEFENFLNSGDCFKLILGAGNEDVSNIREIVETYNKAGCRFFDISAANEIFNVVKKTISPNSFICISIGVSDDVHFKKCKIDKNSCKNCKKCISICPQSAISKDLIIEEKKCIGCAKCLKTCKNKAISTYSKENKTDFNLLNKADCVEFHISSKNKKEILQKWKELCLNYDGILSICLNRKYFSDNKMIKILSKMLKIRKNYKTIIQADGNPMSGGKNDYLSSLQAIALADFINSNFKNVYLFLSGGTNAKTKELLNLFNLNPTGISFGSYARKIIKNSDNPIKNAQELINSSKGVHLD